MMVFSHIEPAKIKINDILGDEPSEIENEKDEKEETKETVKNETTKNKEIVLMGNGKKEEMKTVPSETSSFLDDL